jgi:hypothetical protein
MGFPLASRAAQALKSVMPIVLDALGDRVGKSWDAGKCSMLDCLVPVFFGVPQVLHVARLREEGVARKGSTSPGESSFALNHLEGLFLKLDERVVCCNVESVVDVRGGGFGIHER